MAMIKRNPTEPTPPDHPEWDIPRIGRYFEGGPRDDVYYGGDGNDNINGNGGNDTFAGLKGSDTIMGMDGVDTIDGGDGDDKLYGGNGDDFITGGNGNDLINGGGESDTLDGDAGNDTIHGAGGSDTIRGGAGDDTIHGGEGFDNLRGGEGADTFVYLSTDLSWLTNSYTADTIYDFERGIDRIDLRSLGHAPGAPLFLDDRDGVGGEAGEIMIYGSPAFPNVTFLQIDFQGDGHIDFGITLMGVPFDPANPLDTNDILLS